MEGIEKSIHRNTYVVGKYHSCIELVVMVYSRSQAIRDNAKRFRN
jgi:hypothetical protein